MAVWGGLTNSCEKNRSEKEKERNIFSGDSLEGPRGCADPHLFARESDDPSQPQKPVTLLFHQ